MKNKALLFGLVFVLSAVFLAGAASAQLSSRDLAESWYQQANESYMKGDCLAASKAADNALTKFTEIADEIGKTKTTNLIISINLCLRSSADAFYQQAFTFYNNKSWDDSMLYSQRAKEYYAALKDNDGAAKAQNLWENAKAAKESDTCSEADYLYNVALRYFESKNYLSSKESVTSAFEKYTLAGGCGDGISKSEDLIKAVDQAIFTTGEEARTELRRAQDSFIAAQSDNNFKKYLGAKESATTAKDLFTKIGDYNGTQYCNDLISQIGVVIQTMEGELGAEAEDSYNKGLQDFIRGKASYSDEEKLFFFNSAISYISNSSYLYGQLKQWSYERSDGEKIRTYNGYIERCNNKIEEINSEKAKISRGQLAEAAYGNASYLLGAGRCVNASDAVNYSRMLFAEINDQPNVYKCDTLIYQISECLKRINTAGEYLERAREFYSVADYLNATNETEKALALCTETKNEECIQSAEKFLDNISASKEKKSKADATLIKANMSLKNNDFEGAIANADSAYKMYRDINYSNGTYAASYLRNESKRRQEEGGRDAFQKLLLTVGVVVLAIIGISANWYLKRQRRAKKDAEEMAMQKKMAEEAFIKQKEEEKVEESARLKELEAERKKLKAMIAEEMKKMETEKKKL